MIWERNSTKRKTEEKKQSKVLKIQQSKSNFNISMRSICNRIDQNRISQCEDKRRDVVFLLGHCLARHGVYLGGMGYFKNFYPSLYMKYVETQHLIPNNTCGQFPGLLSGSD